MSAIRFKYDDGGRAAAGYRGETRDCVCRAIAIATQIPYLQVYEALNSLSAQETRRRGRPCSSREGVSRQTYQRYLGSIGWEWTSLMGIGTGCKFHLRDGELPAGRLIVRLSRHLAAVIDGVLHDTFDGSRDGTRCVYGYFSKSR